jgi:light-harvesting complex II chlorophyll a/b binding protein 4
VYLVKGASNPEKVAMNAAFGTKKAPAAPAKASKSDERQLWYPTAVAPDYLDGSLPGDRGFDPLGLSKPVEYIQYDFDQLDQNAPKNKAGEPIGLVRPVTDQVSTTPLQPYSEVFGIQRFRECELLHGRWAMLAVLGCLVSEAVTGVAWQDAGLVEAGQATYWGFDLPFSGSQIVWFEVLTMGFVEIFRNTELDLEKRCYPGGAFDPLGLTQKDEETTFRLKEAELKHGRLAMLAFLGFAVAAGRTGLGATMAFNSFANSFN